jgi:tetratricopeptide (TPR) repeat protein
LLKMQAAADALGLGEEAVADVPIDHLDYSYVAKCESSKELKQILAYLRSGREGRFDDLERAVEAKLLSVLTPLERAKYEALNHVPTRDEVSAAGADVASWLEQIKGKRLTAPAARTVPPPRGQKTAAPHGPAAPTPAPQPAVPPALSSAELDAMAEREKVKGNECFREGDFSRSASYYTRSLEYRKTPVVLCNRAMARLKLKQFEFAEEDCTEAIALDAKLVKAWVRRATARMAMGRHEEAVSDLSSASQLDQDAAVGAEISRLLAEARAKADAGSRVVAAHHPSQDAPTPVHPVAPAAAPRRGRRLVIQEEEEEGGSDAPFKATAVASAPLPASVVVEESVVVQLGAPHAAALAPHTAAALASAPHTAAALASAAADPPKPPPTALSSASLQPSAAATASSWEKHKSDGNAAVAAGRFKDALALYSLALEAAPQEDRPRLNRATIRCNSALARLRELDYAGAVADCSAALQDDMGISDAELSSWSSGSSVPELANDIATLIVKALFRRATALVSLEPPQKRNAAADLRAALALEPHNEKLRQQLREIEAQLSATFSALPAAVAISAADAASTQKVQAVAAAVSPHPLPVETVSQPPSSPERAAAPTAGAIAPVTEKKSRIEAASTPPPSAGTASSSKLPSNPQRSSPVTPGPLLASLATSPLNLSGAAALAVQRAQHWNVPPATAMEFEKSVKSLRSDSKALYAYLRAHVPGSTLFGLFQRRALEPDTLTAVIAAMHEQIVTSAGSPADGPAMVYTAELLSSIPRTRDAATVLMMASAGDRKKLDDLILLIEKGEGGKGLGSELRAALLG